jgi:amidase
MTKVARETIAKSYRRKADFQRSLGYTYDVLPAGLTFLGDSFSEGTLIKFAYAYEQATKNRHPPSKFPPLK